MKIVRNWREVLRHAWSLRLIAVAGILSGLELVLPYLGVTLSINPFYLTLATFLVTMAAVIARLVAQKTVTDSTK